MIHHRIHALRKEMEKRGIKAYWIPGTDPHRAEYSPACWQRRKFISGFTGSAGDVVITEVFAGLWTDARYYLQAEAELDLQIYTLFKMGTPGVPSMHDFLADTLEPGQRLGVDPRLVSHRDYEKLRIKLARNDGILSSLEENLVDSIWPSQPELPLAGVQTHELCYAGESFLSKVNRLRDLMKNHDVKAHVVTLLDGVAWLFNLRGGDTPYSPLAIAYALITPDRALLFIDPRKVDDTVRSQLGVGVTVQPYEDFPKGLETLRAAGTKTWIDPTTCNRWVVGQLQPGSPLFFKESPIDLFKALKNETEIQGFRVAHLRDGLALVRFIKWLEEAVAEGRITELTASAKLQEFRCVYPHYRGPSFESIVAFKEHGAVVHYMPTSETDLPMEIPGLLLVDSGAQYLEGTTDVTRVFALGEPTEEQKDRFTRVLKGHIRLVTQLFPSGTKGVQLDVLARSDLWACGLDFGHGTGHGVGSYLSAHEGPVSISPRTKKGIPLAPGMVCSVEPGYYKEGEYGIRLENLVVVQEASEISRNLSPFLKFEILTLCPFDLKLVKRELLYEKERAWLNQYHEALRKSLTPLLEEEESQWLIKATQEI